MVVSLALLWLGLTDAFQLSLRTTKTITFVGKNQNIPLFMSTFAADGSEYSSKDSDYDDDELPQSKIPGQDFEDEEEMDAPVQELSPVPMSKNAGNRFVALIWDQDLDSEDRDALDLHEERNELVEDHVMFCRKRNLYNETFNTDSMVDILRSLPM